VYVPHSLDKQWPEKFVSQITGLNDEKTRISREFSIAKKKINTIQLARRKHLLHNRNRNLICWLDFYVVRMDTKEIEFSVRYMGCGPTTTKQNTFCKTHQPVTGVENPSKFENCGHCHTCIYIYHGWSGEGLKLEVETEYTERLCSLSSDVSRFEWESLAIIWVPQYLCWKL